LSLCNKRKRLILFLEYTILTTVLLNLAALFC
jgi:hypothetical protein